MSQITSIKPLALQRSQRMRFPPLLGDRFTIVLIIQCETGGEPASNYTNENRSVKKQEATLVPRRILRSD